MKYYCIFSYVDNAIYCIDNQGNPTETVGSTQILQSSDVDEYHGSDDDVIMVEMWESSSSRASTLKGCVGSKSGRKRRTKYMNNDTASE